jgi:hypothetical protein
LEHLKEEALLDWVNKNMIFHVVTTGGMHQLSPSPVISKRGNLRSLFTCVGGLSQTIPQT